MCTCTLPVAMSELRQVLSVCELVASYGPEKHSSHSGREMPWKQDLLGTLHSGTPLCMYQQAFI